MVPNLVCIQGGIAHAGLSDHSTERTSPASLDTLPPRARAHTLTWAIHPSRQHMPTWTPSPGPTPGTRDHTVRKRSTVIVCLAPNVWAFVFLSLVPFYPSTPYSFIEVGLSWYSLCGENTRCQSRAQARLQSPLTRKPGTLVYIVAHSSLLSEFFQGSIRSLHAQAQGLQV